MGGPSAPITQRLPGLQSRSPPTREQMTLENLDGAGAKTVSWWPMGFHGLLISFGCASVPTRGYINWTFRPGRSHGLPFILSSRPVKISSPLKVCKAPNCYFHNLKLTQLSDKINPFPPELVKPKRESEPFPVKLKPFSYLLISPRHLYSFWVFKCFWYATHNFLESQTQSKQGNWLIYIHLLYGPTQ
jgi:hypothetical protein